MHSHARLHSHKFNLIFEASTATGRAHQSLLGYGLDSSQQLLFEKGLHALNQP